MVIIFSKGSGVRLVESLKGLIELEKLVTHFLQSSRTKQEIPAKQPRALWPTEEALSGFVVEKSPENESALIITVDRWLLLRGSPDECVALIKMFHFESDEEGGHHHSHFAMPNLKIRDDVKSFLIQADTPYIEELVDDG